MRLTYHPAGQDEPTVWTFDLGAMRSQEVEAIEKRTGLVFGSEFREQLLKGGSLARRALLWTFQRRAHPFLRFDDVDFADSEVVIELDAREMVAQRDEIRKLVEAGKVNADDAETALMMLDAQIDEWRREHPDTDPEEDGEGKALTPSSSPGGGSPSPKSSTSRRSRSSG